MTSAVQQSRTENVLPIATKPNASIVYVTPEMAKRWLKANTGNRKVRPATVKAYARDMAAGQWQVTGEGVKFSPDGVLLDGQHRLAAVVASGATVPMFVMRGIPAAGQTVMDTGRKRTASDALAIAGRSHTATTASIARLILGVEAELPDPARYEATHSEIEAVVSVNPSVLSAAVFASQTARRTDCPASVVGYTYWRLAHIDQFEAAAFWMAAADKVGLRAGDPVIALTNRLAESRRNRQTLSKPMYLSLIFRAWNARREGRVLRHLRVTSINGVVPVPEPK